MSETIEENIEWYKQTFGICCECENFMIYDVDCIESIAIWEHPPKQECSEFKKSNDTFDTRYNKIM